MKIYDNIKCLFQKKISNKTTRPSMKVRIIRENNKIEINSCNFLRGDKEVWDDRRVQE